HQGFQLFVVEAVHVVGADALGAGELHFGGHGGRGDEFAVFPVAAVGGDFADVDLGVEVGGEGVAVVAAVDVDDVEGVDLVEVVLGDPGGEDVGGAGVEAGAEQGHEARLLEALPVGPLPAVFELGGVEGLVVGGVEVVDAGFEAGVHDGEVLVGQGDVDHQLGLLRLQQGGELGHVVGIHLGGADGAALHALDVGGDGLALGLGAAGQQDVGKHLGQLRAFVGDDAADATGADDDDFCHGSTPSVFQALTVGARYGVGLSGAEVGGCSGFLADLVGG